MGVSSGLVDEADIIYTVNKLLELFELEEYDREFTPENFTKVEDVTTFPLEETLKEMLDYAQEKGLLKGEGVVYRDLFDTRIMGSLVPRPSDVIYTFGRLYEEKRRQGSNRLVLCIQPEYRLYQKIPYQEGYEVEG